MMLSKKSKREKFGAIVVMLIAVILFLGLGPDNGRDDNIQPNRSTSADESRVYGVMQNCSRASYYKIAGCFID